MGILDRVLGRQATDTTTSQSSGPGVPTPTDEATPSAEREPDEVIRGIPAWSQLAPIELVTPTMPRFVGFPEGSLATLSQPIFLEDLGHLVTDEAPAGLVEAISILPVVDTPDELLRTGEEPPALGTDALDLPLVVPHREADHEDDPEAAIRRAMDPRLAVVAPIPAPVWEGDRSATPALAEEPMPTTLPLVGPQGQAPSMVTAPTPADLPRLALPSLPLSESLREALSTPPPQVAGLVGVGSEDLAVSSPAGEMPGFTPAVTVDDGGQSGGSTTAGAHLPLARSAPTDTPIARGAAPDVAAPAPSDTAASSSSAPPAAPSARPAGGESAELSAATQAPAPVAAETTPALLDDPGAAPGPERVAPLVGERPAATAPAVGAVAGPDEEEPGGMGTASAEGGRDADLPLAAPSGQLTGSDRLAAAPRASDEVSDGTDEVQPVPVFGGAPPGEGPVVVAPLVGSEERMAVVPTEPAPDEEGQAEQLDSPDSRPSGRPKVGLGAPMAGLPNTSRSYDLTQLSVGQRHALANSLLQSQLDRLEGRSPAAPAGPGRGPDLALPTSAPRYPVRTAPAALPGTPVTSEPGPPAVEGALPPGLPEFSGQMASLISLRAMGDAAGATGEQPDPEGARARDAVEQKYGVALDVPVDRSPNAALDAHMAGARAFTTESGIVIPAEAGSLDSGSGEALLVHELTHVAQRIRPGGGPAPDERSPEGQRLETEAMRNEQSFAATRTLPSVSMSPEEPPLASLPVFRPMFSSPSSSFLNRRETIGSDTLPLAVSTSAGIDVQALADSVVARVSEQIAEPLTPQTTTHSAPEPAMSSAGGGMQRAAETAPLPTESETPAAFVENQPMEQPSHADLDRLSNWLYPLIRFRLRRELREDRDRSGLLTDHYGRW